MKSRDKVSNSSLKAEIKRDLLVLLLLSAILKIIIFLFVGVINHDGVLYITSAQQLAAGSFKEALDIYGMPLYPLLIALTHYIVPNWIAAARLVSIVASVLTIIPIYLLTEEFFYRKAALWACSAFALLPLSNHLSIEVVRGPLFLSFLAWAIYFAHRAINSKRLIYFFLSSLLGLFSFLCRLEGLVFYIFYVLFVFYLFLRRPNERGYLLKGISIYIFLPLSLFIIGSLVLDSGWTLTFNRLDKINREVEAFFSLRFLNNYKLIYKRLGVFAHTLPYKPRPQNFMEITRHYMPVIYLIGLLESFCKALFPLYLLPLVVGFWHWKKQRGVFILMLAGCYFLLSFFFLIRIDSIRVRYLLTSAMLLIPWVGLGLDQIFTYVRSSPRRHLLTGLFVLLLGVLPLYRSVKILQKQDNVLQLAGKWIAKVPQLQGAGIITNDRRVPFYAGRGLDQTLYMKPNYFAMEKFALKKGGDLLIIKTSKKTNNSRPLLKKFRKVKEFVGVKDIVNIYCSPRLYREVKGET